LDSANEESQLSRNVGNYQPFKTAPQLSTTPSTPTRIHQISPNRLLTSLTHTYRPDHIQYSYKCPSAGHKAVKRLRGVQVQLHST